MVRMAAHYGWYKIARSMVPRSARDILIFVRFHSVHLLSQSAMKAWHEWKLASIIPYLSRNVPLYKELLSKHPSSSLFDGRHLDVLPIMDTHSFEGRFLEEYTDRRSPFIVAQATVFRSETRVFLLRRPHLIAPRFRDSLRYRFLLWERPWRLSASWARIAQVATHAGTEPNHLYISEQELAQDASVAQRISTYEPYVVESHLPALQRLVDTVQKRKLPLHPRYCVVVAPQLERVTRRSIENALRCEIYNRFDLDEFGPVGIECRIHDGFHIHVESFMIEIVDDAGHAVPENREGRILVTDLYNYQMPFIRYNIEMRGRMSWQLCACGLRSPRLWLES